MLTFDPDCHEYRWSGNRLPSVSEVLRRLAKLSGIAPDVLEFARARGQAVHKAIELDIAGDLDESSLHPEVSDRFYGWRRFVQTSKFQAQGSEVRVMSQRYGYAGTFDLWGYIRREPYLIDIKATALVPPTVGLQTAAYAQAARETLAMPPMRRGVLQLGPEGRWQFLPLTRALDLREFLDELEYLRRHDL